MAGAYGSQQGLYLADLGGHMAALPQGSHAPVLLSSPGFGGHYLQPGPPGHPAGGQLMHFPGAGYLPVAVGMQPPGQEHFSGSR